MMIQDQDDSSFSVTVKIPNDTSIETIMTSPQLREIATLQNIGNIITLDPKMAFTVIVAYVFGTYSKVQRLDAICSQMPKGLCAGAIEIDDQTYKCDDCGRETNFHIFCAKCFEAGFRKGLHKGHRYKSKNRRSGCCDCGDHNALEQSGFCPEHTGESKCDVLLEEDVCQRLTETLQLCFKVVFDLCEKKIKHMPYFQNQGQIKQSGIQESMLVNSIQSLTSFISEFCKQKLPLQFAISRILMAPLDRQLNHNCNQNNFSDTFRADEKHVCQQSIMSLILRHGIAFDTYEKKVSGMLYSLFVNGDYKMRLAEGFLSNFEFLCIFAKNQSKSIMRILNLHQIYCQFFGDAYTQNMIRSQEFDNITKQLVFAIDKVNGLHFLELYKFAFQLIQVFHRLKAVCEEQKQESLAVLLIWKLVKTFYHTTCYNGYSFDHHKIKTYMVYLLTAVILDLSSMIKYKDPDVRNSLLKTVQVFLLQIEVGKLEVEMPESNQQGLQLYLEKISFRWYCLPEISIGIMIVHFFSKFGLEELRMELNKRQLTDHLGKYIRRLVDAQVDAYRLSVSHEVGFPGEFPPKDLYKHFYKHPTRAIYDCVISILQVMALVVPACFLKQIQDIPFVPLVQLLSDVFMQESCYVNISSKAKTQDKLYRNSLKIQMINILNLRHQISFTDLNKTFLQYMLVESINFNEILEEVALYDQKSETYSINPDYKDLLEASLLRRVDGVFGKFFQQEYPESKLLKKDNLFKKQLEQGWTTLCMLVTAEVGNVPDFPSFFQKLLSQIWISDASIKNYQYAKLVEVVFLRNGKQGKIQDLVGKLMSGSAETPIQRLIINVVSTINRQSGAAMEEIKGKEASKSTTNRMQLLRQKMRKKQQQFVDKNAQLIQDQQKSHKNQEQINSESICLICQQSQIQTQHPGFVMQVKVKQIQGEQCENYSSCGHLFHLSCINKQSPQQCPVCRHPFNNHFPFPPPSQLHMLNPTAFNRISHQVTGTYQMVMDEQQYHGILEMICSKVYLSILESCTKFALRDRLQLRSIYCKVICQQNEMSLDYDTFQKIMDEEKEVVLDSSLRIKVFMDLLKFMIGTPLQLGDSISTIKAFKKMIRSRYTTFLAYSFLCFVDQEELKQNVGLKYKQYEDALKARMNEFCKGVIYAYSVVFDDERNQILEAITNQDNIAQVLINQYPQFFTVDKNMFMTYIDHHKDSPFGYNKSHQSLVPVPPVITLPENFMEFHKKYNDLICDECDGIIKVHNDKSWMCLLCGYKACLKDCPALQNKPPLYSLFYHFQSGHSRQGLAIDLNSSLVLIIEGKDTYNYGYLYQNKFGNQDSDQIKDWTSLKLHNTRWNKLLELLRKRTLGVYAVQNILKQESFNG